MFFGQKNLRKSVIGGIELKLNFISAELAREVRYLKRRGELKKYF
jgi:hypothetical protein